MLESMLENLGIGERLKGKEKDLRGKKVRLCRQRFKSVSNDVLQPLPLNWPKGAGPK